MATTSTRPSFPPRVRDNRDSSESIVLRSSGQFRRHTSESIGAHAGTRPPMTASTNARSVPLIVALIVEPYPGYTSASSHATLHHVPAAPPIANRRRRSGRNPPRSSERRSVDTCGSQIRHERPSLVSTLNWLSQFPVLDDSERRVAPPGRRPTGSTAFFLRRVEFGAVSGRRPLRERGGAFRLVRDPISF